MTAETPVEGATTETTPSGLSVYYQPNPRLYRVGSGDYWVEVPSVTTVLGVLDKPALPYWGMKVGVEGVLKLLDDGHVIPGSDGLWVNDFDEPIGVDRAVELLVKHKLTVNHQRDKAGARGTSIHNAFENWARFGFAHFPQERDVAPEEVGYLRGLRATLESIGFVPESVEVMVGSIKFGFAGRYDLRATNPEDKEIAVNSRRKVLLPAGKYLCDLKTSSGVYPSHLLQLEAYEGASVECGYDPTDYRLVIQIGAEGKFDLKLSKATYQDFLDVLACYRAMARVKESMKIGSP